MYIMYYNILSLSFSVSLSVSLSVVSPVSVFQIYIL